MPKQRAGHLLRRRTPMFRHACFPGMEYGYSHNGVFIEYFDVYAVVVAHA